MAWNWDEKFCESTRGWMVTVLRRSGCTVEELARALGLTDNGIRAHLAVLERDGIAGSRQPPACEKPRCCFEVASADEVTQR